ncbi:cytochrome c biogenesis CcdA family protein [Nocardioides sp.]|uniref:cytochrome c biogenesis CcdA family protein n=1 Tax=Nocardioides sp. TaxID=35761 RepID=UPI003528AB09
MLVLLGAVVAGVLTTLAPCVLPLLPVIVGGSLSGGGAATRRAFVVAASLGVSVVVFTLLLRASTALIGIDPEVWNVVAGGLLVVLGVISLFPEIWESVSGRLALQQRSTTRLSAAGDRGGTLGAVLTGAALGPVFTSCSPLYGYVVVTVLPAERARGMALLVAYVVGLCGTLLVIALAGQRLVRRLGWLADSHGWFRRSLGLVFIVVGVLVITGLDRDLQAWILENSPWRPWELDQGFIPE